MRTKILMILLFTCFISCVGGKRIGQRVRYEEYSKFGIINTSYYDVLIPLNSFFVTHKKKLKFLGIYEKDSVIISDFTCEKLVNEIKTIMLEDDVIKIEKMDRWGIESLSDSCCLDENVINALEFLWNAELLLHDYVIESLNKGHFFIRDTNNENINLSIYRKRFRNNGSGQSGFKYNFDRTNQTPFYRDIIITE